MIKRSRPFFEVAFFLSKFGSKNPPLILETKSWKRAYHIFYEKANGGRDILSFEHSLKNSRDAFDSHFPDSAREGWKEDDGNARKLGELSFDVFSKLSPLTELQVWNVVSKYADFKVQYFEPVFENLAAIEESEKKKAKVKTEGGLKVFISSKVERNPSLRNDALLIHGYDCSVCGFNFERTYGEWGKNWAEVHHLTPIAENKIDKIVTDPKVDLILLWANCHRMVHRKKGIVLTVKELKNKIRK